uniref:START domain-containing protein n=1 Tax=Anguilla anguilla TaxID=7936 RepID=A0A0E9WVI3_ANGAN
MDYLQITNTVADSLLCYAKDESGWKTCKKTNEVTVCWRPSTEFPGNLYKGDGIINGSPEKVWECLKPVPNGIRVKWDNNVKKLELVETVNVVSFLCRPFLQS